MPRMDNPNPEDQLVKLLLIGAGKSGKSGYAGEAAEAGFNVLFCDGDVATQTLALLSPEAKSRIYVLPFGDRMERGTKIRVPRFQQLLMDMAMDESGAFVWNDTRGEYFFRSQAMTEGWSDEVWKIQLALMDHTWIWVIDSWTSFVESLQLDVQQQLKIDPLVAKLTDMREVYRVTENRANAMLSMIRAARCHVIVLAHPDEYQKTKNPEGAKVGQVKEAEKIIEWTKQIPKSTSRPHSMKMSKYFTDVAWTEVSPSGIRKINFRMSDDRISGGHFDSIEDTDKYSFANLVRKVGGQLPAIIPPPTAPGLEIFPNGTYAVGRPKPLESKQGSTIPLAQSKVALPPQNQSETPAAIPPKGNSLAAAIAASKAKS